MQDKEMRSLLKAHFADCQSSSLHVIVHDFESRKVILAAAKTLSLGETTCKYFYYGNAIIPVECAQKRFREYLGKGN